jgi:replicative DNA helicase Mcm
MKRDGRRRRVRAPDPGQQHLQFPDEPDPALPEVPDADWENLDAGRAVIPSGGDVPGFDPLTHVLARSGWKPIAAIGPDDPVATLDPESGTLVYENPTHRHARQHDGPMYSLTTKHVSILATPNHKLWVARPHSAYRTVRADAFFASHNEWQFKKDCTWAGVEQPWMEFRPFRRHTARTQYLDRVPMDDWLEFLGYYLAEGRSCTISGGGHQVQISQFRTSPAWPAIDAVLGRLGLRYSYQHQSNRFQINSLWLHGVLMPLGDAYTKFVPDYVQDLGTRQLRILLDAYLAGDGYEGACWEYGSSSERLAVDIQVICLKLGWSVTVKVVDRSDNWQKHMHWRGRINRSHLRPWWKKGRMRTYRSVREEMVPYAGNVFGVTVSNHVIYVKREDKTYWAGDSSP